VTTTYRAALAGALFLVLLTGIICRFHTPPPTVHLIACVDASQSDRPNLPASIEASVRIYRALYPGRDFLSLYRLDDQLLPLHDDRVRDTPATYEDLMVTELTPISSQDNTYTEKFWLAAAQSAAEDNMPVIIVFFTDGFSEGTSKQGHRMIQQAAAALAANPHVFAVVILGAAPETWSSLEADLYPLRRHLGRDCFVIQSDCNATAALSLIAAARAEGGKSK